MAGLRRVLLVCVGLLIIQSACARRCYTCTLCNDPFNANADGVSIDENCIGSCFKIKADGNVARSCSVLSLGDKCESKTEDGVKGEACSCDTDLCNSSPRLDISLTAVCVSALVVLVRQLI